MGRTTSSVITTDSEDKKRLAEVWMGPVQNDESKYLLYMIKPGFSSEYLRPQCWGSSIAGTCINPETHKLYLAGFDEATWPVVIDLSRGIPNRTGSK